LLLGNAAALRGAAESGMQKINLATSSRMKAPRFSKIEVQMRARTALRRQQISLAFKTVAP
jgi:hypothetical protein